MPTIPYLDSATENRISRALTKVADCVAGGDSATDAIVKVARQDNFSSGQAELMVRAYNTGRTLHQLDVGETLAEKLAEFPLADAKTVQSALFPDAVKTAADEQKDVAISNDYTFSPQGWLNRLVTLENAEKQAAVLTAARAERRPTKTAAYTGNEATRKVDAVFLAERAASDANQALSAAKYAAAESLAKLAEYFRQPYAVPLVTVKENAELLYGAKATQVLDSIAEDHPHLLKQAARRHPVDWNQAPYSLLVDCFTKAAAYVAAGSENMAKQLAVKEAREVLYAPFAPPPLTATSSILDPPSSTDDVKVASTVANPALWAGVGGSLGSAIKDITTAALPNKESLVKSHMGKLQDPAHEQQLRGIRTQSLLADLMLNDQVISGYGQDEVLDAYTRLSEVAPNAVNHKLLAQALLRKYLEQGNQLESFDMDQLIGIENKLKTPPVPMLPAGPPK